MQRFRAQVVVSTNISETSVTIEGIMFVVDCCYVKQRVYNPITGLEALVTAPISRAAAVQRAGRAGRMRPGHAFRLCTQHAFDTLLQEATVGALKTNLQFFCQENAITFFFWGGGGSAGKFEG